MIYDPHTPINGSAWTMFVNCSLFSEDKDEKAKFFGETFLLANISTDVLLGMPFPTLSNANVRFSERQLFWRAYTTGKALSTTRRSDYVASEGLPTTGWVEIMNRKEFVVAAFQMPATSFLLTAMIRPERGRCH